MPALLTAVVDGGPSSLLGWDVRNHQDLGLVAITEFTGSTSDPLDLSDRLLHAVAELAHGAPPLCTDIPTQQEEQPPISDLGT